MSFDDVNDEPLPTDGIIVETYQPLTPHEADALRHEMRRYHENRIRQRLTVLAELSRLERLWRIEAMQR